MHGRRLPWWHGGDATPTERGHRAPRGAPWVLRRASSAPSTRWSGRSRSTERPSTSASRSCTTCTSCATSSPRARSSSRRRPRCPRARSSCCRPTASRPRCTSDSAERELEVIDATCPLVTKVHVEARRFAAEGRTIILIGHAGHEEVEGTSGQAPERTILVQIPGEARTVERRRSGEPALPHADHAVASTRPTRSSRSCRSGSRRSRGRPATTSATRRRTARTP